MPPQQDGLLFLFGTAQWCRADGSRLDLPDSLPGYLIARLVCRDGWVARDTVAAEFWPARGEQESLANLRSNLHRVREVLSAWGCPQALQAEPRRLRIEIPSDVAAFRAALTRTDWATAAEFEGDGLLSSMSFRGFARIEEWAAQERQALAAAWRGAATKAARWHTQAGDPRRAAALLLRALRSDVANESALCELLRLAGAAERRDEALAAYERYRQWLAAELALSPSPETTALAEALARPASPSAGRPAAEGEPAAEEPGLLLFGAPVLRAAPALAITSERRFQLLVLLAVRSGEWLAREQLATLLWPEQPVADARRNLRHALFKARELPGTEGLEANDHSLRWSVATDVQAFRRALEQKRPGEALRLHRGPLAVGMDDPGNRAYSEWIAAERSRLQAQWRQAALDHLQGLQAAERIELARMLLQADPFDEAAFAALLAAELARGHRAQAQRLYRDYAARLADELGIEPPQHLRDLLAGASAAASTSSADDGTFVGRRTERAELALLLQQPDCRLITIAGPGGVGKSSLARRVLAQECARFPGGTAWVELQDLRSLSAVLARLATRLNLTLNDAQDPLPQIARQLQGRRTLAVLDNAEHLAELPATLERLLDEADSLSIVLTSRIRTHVRHERLLPLDGLAVPDEESRDLEVASKFDAVRLFDLRAGAVQRGFDLARHLPAVIGIVETVGGLPLAIELAAAWTRLLPAEEIARDLGQTIDVLERDPAAAGEPARPEHASLRRVLDRSWQLLAASERAAMAALSVFQGGFSHAAARAVAGIPLPVLSSLVDRSMLKADPAGRFDMHPLLSADAAERASGDGQARQVVSDRHAEYFAHRLRAAFGDAAGDARAISDVMRVDEANCLLAWRHAVGRGRHDLVDLMHAAWRAYFKVSGRFRQGVAHFELALARDGPPHAMAELRATLAYLLYRDRRVERAIGLAGESLALAEKLGDTALALSSASTIGGCKLIQGEWEQARHWLERALQLARASGVRGELASQLSNLALITTFVGEFDRAIRLYAEAIAIQSELGNTVSAARAMCNLGFVHVARGDWKEAQRELEEALRYAVEQGIASVALEAEFLLGSVEVELDLQAVARRRLEHSREGFRAARNDGFVLKVDCYLARITARRGDAEEGARVLLEAIGTARARGWGYDVSYASIFLAEVLAGRGHAREAAMILHSIGAAPRSHAFIGTLVQLGLRALAPEHGGDTRSAVPFDALAERLAGSRGIDETLLRLRAAMA